MNIIEAWNQLKAIILTVFNTLIELETTINNTTMTADALITENLALLRYLLGNSLYMLLMSIVNVTILFFLYRIIKIALDSFNSQFPSVFGKFKLL